MPFGTLPEYIVEDLADFLIFLANYAPDTMQSNAHPAAIARLLVTLIGNAKLVRNGYLRAKLVEAIAVFSPERMNGAPSPFFQTVQVDDVSVTILSRSLMQFYVDAEDTDFYMRLTMRFNVQVVLKELWRSPRSRQGFIDSASSEAFVRFVMLLINDTTFLLDEGRTLLDRIRTNKGILARSRDAKELDEAEAALQQAERQISAVSNLADETLNMFSYITSDIVEPFLRPELVHRLAAMLNFNLAALVGPQAKDWRSANPEEYGINPAAILRKIVDIYLHCSRIQHNTIEPAFVAAVVNDGRSYSPELMEKIVVVLKSVVMADPATVETFRALCDHLRQAHADVLADDADLGDIPDEYLDPILSTLMRDPVTLPISKVTVDRATILQHLLSDPTDPFNKQPLVLADVVPNTALKVEIEAWVAAKRLANINATNTNP